MHWIRMAVVVAVMAMGGGCECEPEEVCDLTGDELGDMTYHDVQELARERGECLTVCYGSDIERTICPD